MKLRPTQMALGLREVDEKIRLLKELKPKEAQVYLKARPIPVVLGSSGRSYLIDRHHLVRASAESGVDGLRIEVKADLSSLTPEKFWAEMSARRWVHLYDQFGRGPHDPIHLPETVRGMADDPYRSVAGAVRRLGACVKSAEPFAEFLWAEFFRKHLTLHPVFHDYQEAVDEAMKLARNPLARHLPGYAGPNSSAASAA